MTHKVKSHWYALSVTGDPEYYFSVSTEMAAMTSEGSIGVESLPDS